jgi:hypothetical protein
VNQAETQTAVAQVSDINEEEDLSWLPEKDDGQAAIADYYEAESWQFSGCGD